MKICLLSNLASSLISFRGALIQRLLALGEGVMACTPAGDHSVAATLAAWGAEYHAVSLRRTNVSPWLEFIDLIHLYRFFKTYRPAILLNYTPKAVILGSIAARWARVPHVCSTITGLGFFREVLAGSQTQLMKYQMGLLYRTALRANKIVFFQNPDDLALFTKARWVRDNTETIVVNGSGVDLEHYQHVPPDISHPKFLMVARLLRSKGLLEYAAAARRVRIRWPNAEFRLIGPVDQHPDSVPEDVVRGWHSEGIVQYGGSVNDVRPALIRSSVFVLPSYYGEGIPRTALEALAVGRAVITTDHPGCRETVRHGKNGFLVRIRDDESLAAACERFVREPPLVLTMGDESRCMAVSRFDVHEVNCTILGALSRLPGCSHFCADHPRHWERKTALI